MADVAIILEDVLYPHNLAAAIRAAACFGASHVVWTGDRFEFSAGERLPREERMKGYTDVHLRRAHRPLDYVAHVYGPGQLTPVCVELTPGAAPLWTFEHPERAVYVFGPEDGHVSAGLRAKCHRFVYIPAHHCLNLAAAVNVVLAHRAMQREEFWTPVATEGRGIIEVPGWDGK
jgi:tRNA(Leu) C34 or U34 (ribose-2'-O)-methylase TrmL